jgi:hypothetical protein
VRRAVGVILIAALMSAAALEIRDLLSFLTQGAP